MNEWYLRDLSRKHPQSRINQGLFPAYCVTKGMKKAAFLFFRVEVRNAACAVQYLVVVQTMLVRCPKNLDFTMFQKVSLSNLIF